MIHSDRLTALFCSLAQISSPTFGERKMADRLTAELLALGFQVTEDDGANAYPEATAGNLHAWLPGEGEPLLFCAHMDTVGPCQNKTVVRTGDTIRSDGTTTLGSDDLAGVVEILEAVHSLEEEQRAHRPIEVLFTFGEEFFLRGALALNPALLVSKEAYVLDVDGEVGAAILRAPTGIRIIVHIHGTSAHAGMSPETGVNAIQIAARALDRIPYGRLDAETTANAGIIRGGAAGNIVPDSCMVELETRSLHHAKAEAQWQRVKAAFEEAAQTLGGTVAFEISQPLTAYQVPEDAAVVRRFVQACKAEGIKPQLSASCGGSDNTVLSQLGIQGVVLAAGMHDIHSVNEWTTVTELTQMAHIVERLMTDQ